MNKDGASKQVKKNEVDKFLSLGWEKGRPVSTASGLVWVCKDGNDKRVKPEQVESYLSKGYSVGRSTSCPTEGKVLVSNYGTSMYVPKELVDVYVSNGWVKGSVKLSSTKGKVVVVNVETEETSIVDTQVAKSLVSSGLYRYNSSRRVHLYNPDTLERVMVFPNQVKEFEIKGYVRGRPKNYTPLVFWMHNDTLKRNKRVKFEDVPVYEQQGWVRGQGRYNKN